MDECAECNELWRRLIEQKRQRKVRIIYRITLIVRGRQIVKEYPNEDDYRKWKETYEDWRRRRGSGIEQVESRLVYR